MKNILVVESSPRGEASVTRQLTKQFVEKLKAKNPSANIVTRDLTRNPVPHLEEINIQAFFTPPANHSPELAKAVLLSDTLTDELLAADTIILAAPMWNFGIPSVLKAWIDNVSRAGKTFSFGPEGLKGLAAGKKVFIVTSSGSVFSEGPFASYDMFVPYLKTFLGFIGITDVTLIRAEGVNDPAAQATSIAKATQLMEQALA
jgi:FMN-dependent NADH-azoreductase